MKLRFLALPALLLGILSLAHIANASAYQPTVVQFGPCLSAQPASPLVGSGTMYSQDAIDDQRGVTSYTIPASDACKTILAGASMPVSMTLPGSLQTPPILPAAGLLPGTGASVKVQNYGPSTVTLTQGQVGSTTGTSVSAPSSSIALTVIVGSVGVGNRITDSANTCLDISEVVLITGQTSGPPGGSGVYTVNASLNCSNAAMQIYSSIGQGGATLAIPANTGCRLTGDAYLNLQISDCPALLPNPNSRLYALPGSVVGTMQAVSGNLANAVLGSDFLSNASYWTATGFTSPVAGVSPDQQITGTVFTTGSGSTQSIETVTAVGASRAFLAGIYIAKTTSPITYITLANAANTETVTAWFDTADCVVLSNAVSGGGGYVAGYAVPITSVAIPFCWIGVQGRVNNGNSTATMTVGISSAAGSLAWLGGSGVTISSLWGADLVPSGLSTSNNAFTIPPLHISTGSAGVTVQGTGVVNVGANITNRLLYSQPTAPTVSCNGTGIAALTSGVNSSDAVGSLTTNTGATNCIVSFANKPSAWGMAPICNVQAETASSVATSTETTTALSIALSAAVTGTVVKWQCSATIN